jgi:flagellar hook-length control protein FliK
LGSHRFLARSGLARGLLTEERDSVGEEVAVSRVASQSSVSQSHHLQTSTHRGAGTQPKGPASSFADLLEDMTPSPDGTPAAATSTGASQGDRPQSQRDAHDTHTAADAQSTSAQTSSEAPIVVAAAANSTDANSTEATSTDGKPTDGKSTNGKSTAGKVADATAAADATTSTDAGAVSLDTAANDNPGPQGSSQVPANPQPPVTIAAAPAAVLPTTAAQASVVSTAAADATVAAPDAAGANASALGPQAQTVNTVASAGERKVGAPRAADGSKGSNASSVASGNQDPSQDPSNALAAPDDGAPDGAGQVGQVGQAGQAGTPAQARAATGAEANAAAKTAPAPVRANRDAAADVKPDDPATRIDTAVVSNVAKSADAPVLTTLSAQGADRAAAPSAAADPTAAALNAATSVPIAGLPVAIAREAQAGNSRFEIRLDPPELGRIDVRLDVDRDGHVTSRVTVEKPETLDLLQRDAPQLERALQDAGLKTSDNGLQFQLRDQGAGSQNQAWSGNGRADTARIVVPDPDLPKAAVQASYGGTLRLGGGIDIRV